MKDCVCIIVTYNTPQLIKNCVKSVLLHYPQLKILIVDGSSKHSVCYEVVDMLARKFSNVDVIHAGYNIGHGNGMVLGIEKTDQENIILLDSDTEIHYTVFDEMKFFLQSSKFIYGVGEVVKVNANGMNVDQDGIPYLHPYCAMIKRSAYKKYQPIIHHGAPMIKAMLNLHRHQGMYLKHFDLKYKVEHKCRGTRNVISQQAELLKVQIHEKKQRVKRHAP